MLDFSTRLSLQNTIMRMTSPTTMWNRFGVALAFPVMLGSAYLTACTAELGGAGDAADSGAGASTPGGGSGASTGGTSADPGLPQPGGLRRLTPSQYHRALVDLLGDIGEPQVVEALPAGAELIEISASTTAISPTGVENFEKAANAALETVYASAGRRDAFVGCSPEQWNDACVQDFVARVGLNAWRRPVAQEELERYLELGRTVATETGLASEGTRAIVSAILQSPYFLYRVELGEGASSSELSPYEMASRMSFLLWGAAPDSQLLEAAANGALDSPEGRAVEAQRLLDSERFSDGISDLATDLLSLDSVFMMSKDLNLFPELTPSLRQAMRDELLLLFQNVALSPEQDLLGLLDTRRTFVNEELGALYGISVSGPEMQLAEHPNEIPRSGILTSALLLSARDKRTETSPTRRGEFVSAVFSCLEVPPPPPGVDTALPEPAEGVSMTRRERLAAHLVSPSCASCHLLTDPVGLSFENFDALGKYRTRDESGLEIDASGAFEGTPYSSPAELGRMMRESERVRECFFERIYRYATGREENAFDSAQVASLSETLADGQVPFKSLMVALVTSSEFYEISAPL